MSLELYMIRIHLDHVITSCNSLCTCRWKATRRNGRRFWIASIFCPTKLPWRRSRRPATSRRVWRCKRSTRNAKMNTVFVQFRDVCASDGFLLLSQPFLSFLLSFWIYKHHLLCSPFLSLLASIYRIRKAGVHTHLYVAEGIPVTNITFIIMDANYSTVLSYTEKLPTIWKFPSQHSRYPSGIYKHLLTYLQCENIHTQNRWINGITWHTKYHTARGMCRVPNRSSWRQQLAPTGCCVWRCHMKRPPPSNAENALCPFNSNMRRRDNMELQVRTLLRAHPRAASDGWFEWRNKLEEFL